MRKHLTTAFLALALMTMAGAAPAQEVEGFAFPGGELGASNIEPGQIYGGATKSVIWLEVPEWTYGQASTPGTPEFDINADGTAFGFNAFVGIGLNANFGKNPRLQLSGGYTTGELEGTAFDVNFTDTFTLLNGTAGGTPQFQTLASLQVDHEAYDFGLRALTDLVVSQTMTFTPSVMVFGGGSMQKYDADILDGSLFPAPPFDAFSETSFVRQNIDTYQVGVEGALSATFAVREDFSIILGGRGALVYLDSDMKGSDCLDASSVTPGCDGGRGTSTVTDKFNKTTYRAGLFGGTMIGLGEHLWNASFGVFGSIDWMPYAAIKNPLTPADGPSHLTLRHEMQYAVSAGFTVPLN